MLTQEEVDELYEPYWYGGRTGRSLSVSEGWLPLVATLLSDITKIEPDFRVLQVKEKFGALRFYCNAVTPEATDLIAQAEQRSTEICEICGNDGQLGVRNGWWSTNCQEDAPEGWEPADLSDEDDDDK